MEMCGDATLDPACSVPCMWYKPGSPLEAEITGVVQLTWVKKVARQESGLGSVLKLWSLYCSSNTSDCQKVTPRWPGACILHSNPHPFPFLSDKQKLIYLDKGQTISKYVTRQCPSWLDVRQHSGSLSSPCTSLSAHTAPTARGVAQLFAAQSSSVVQPQSRRCPGRRRGGRSFLAPKNVCAKKGMKEQFVVMELPCEPKLKVP